MIPVTVIEAGPCVVSQKKTVENDGYVSVQLAYGDVAEKKLSKSELGHLKKAEVSAKKYLKEFKLDNAEQLEVGAEIKADVFAAGDHVDVTGTSKGHGFQGSVKRHGPHIQKMSHGGGPIHRHAGSNGSATDPSRVLPGKKLPGQLGNEQVTIQNLDVVKVDAENNMIVVKGAIPGPKNGIVYIKNAVKA